MESYSTGVTLRQLFYRLVSLPAGERGRIPNRKSAYEQLSLNTARARDEGTFPDLIDQRRRIEVVQSWDSPHEAVAELRDYYRRDHTEGQPYQLWLGVEKDGLKAQLHSWFDDLGLPIISLAGQCSQTFAQQIVRHVDADGRPAVLLYAGDHDPTGWSIVQNFVDRTDCWANPELPDWNPADMPSDYGRKRGHARAWKRIPNFNRYRKFRVALTPEQCDQYVLARNAAKAADPNMDAFKLNFADTFTDDEIDDGCGVQVEVDALEPMLLRQLFTDAIEKVWDTDAYQDVLDEEETDLEALDRVQNLFGDGS